MNAIKDLELYLLVINIAAFVLYGLDKRRAVKNQWRISESQLIGIAAIGGSVGAYLGMRLFHHKTRKPLFSVGVPVIFLVQAAVGIWWFYLR